MTELTNISYNITEGLDMHAVMVVVIASLITALIRFAPFIIFRDKTPEAVIYLGKVLPFAMMGMLVVYCLKSTSFEKVSGFMPSVISLGFIFILHKWKHNTLLSILLGTVCYMVLVQKVF